MSKSIFSYPLIASIDLDFCTCYHQFYILDRDSPADTDSDTFWTEEANIELG
jgi:hypothetical protein